jgi:hypothetical protein
MIRRMLEAMVLGALCAPGLAQGEASVRLLTSPVMAGELVHLEAHLEGELKAPLRGVAAVGSVSPFVQTGPGTYRADFTPGTKVGPALVELAIFEDRVGGQLAVTQANVSDTVRARATVKTHEAVFVRAGSVRKGPFHPDAHGVVNLEFVANGELSEAQLETAQGKSLGAVPLKPLLARTLLLARPARLRAGDSKPGELVLVAPSSTPARSDVHFTASAGKVATEATPVPAGLRYGFLPPASASETIRVTADARGQRLGEASFGVAGPAPKTLTLRVPSKKLGPGERVTLGINVSDAKDQPTDAEITVSSDVGVLSPPVALGPGTFAVAFVAPAQLPSDGQAHLRAQVLGEEVSATGVVIFRGGAPARIVFHAPDRPLRAGEAVRVEAEVLDQAGNPADAHALALAADQGEVSGLQSQGGGRYAFSVRSSGDADKLTLTARDDATTLQGTQALSVEPATALPTALLGLEGGVANNFGQLSTASLAVTGQLLVGPRGEAPVRAAVGFLAGYLPQATRTLRSDASTSAELQLGRVALLARGGAFGALGPVGLYGGVAAGVVKLSGQLVSVGRAPLPLDAVRPAFGLYGGAGYKLGPGYLALELSATQATVDVENSDVRAHGPVGGIDGALAYLFTL